MSGGQREEREEEREQERERERETVFVCEREAWIYSGIQEVDRQARIEKK